MANLAAYALVYLGAALMAYNIYCFVKFARFVKGREASEASDNAVYLPITLLVLFFLGYLAVGLFGNPDLVIGGILFGGSIFVFVMYKLMDRVTQRVIQNERIEAKLAAAEESNRAKSDFLASMSHEMRTPMNVILGLNAMALRNPEISAETRGQLVRMGRSGRYLLDLINNALDMNRIGGGEIAVKREEFSLKDICEQVNAIASTTCDEKGLEYQTSIDQGVLGRYIGDPLMLKQVLFAIVNNAVKYTEAPGAVTFSVDEASCSASARTVAFSIADTGVGISPDFLDKVFDAFDREDASSTTRFGGSGLGLAAAKSKVELMGGGIAVESEKHKGSTFTVTVPLEVAPKEDATLAHGEASSTEAQAPEGEALAGKRILVVEDVAENAEIVCDLLDLEDVVSEHAENGQVAVEMFQQSAPCYYDGVLMDMRMPVMDGLEATRRIRALDRADAKTVPILALTANAFESDVQQALDAGMNAHLEKPIDAEQLYATLRKQTRRAREQGKETSHD